MAPPLRQHRDPFMNSVLASLALGTLLALSAAGPLRAQAPENWPQVKCERWRSAYDEALKRFGCGKVYATTVCFASGEGRDK